MNLNGFRIIQTPLIISIACYCLFSCAGVNKRQIIIMPPTQSKTFEKGDSVSNAIVADIEIQNSGWVIAESANVRERPNTDSKILTTLPRGQFITLMQLNEDWWNITASDTLAGFIKGSLVSKSRFWTFDLPWGLSFQMSFEDVRNKLSSLTLAPERFIMGGCCYVKGDVTIYGCKADADLTFNEAGNLIHILFDFGPVEEDPNQNCMYRDIMANKIKNNLGGPVLEGNALHNAGYSYSPDETIYGLGFRAADNSLILFKDTYYLTEYLSETNYEPRKVLENYATLEFCAPEIADSVILESWK